MAPRHKGHFGGVRKLPNGRFQVRYAAPSGKRLTAGTYLTRKEALTTLARLEAAIVENRYEAYLPHAGETNRITLEEYFKDWFAAQDYKDTTRENYEDIAQRYLLADLPGISLSGFPLETITHDVIRDWSTVNRFKSTYIISSHKGVVPRYGIS